MTFFRKQDDASQIGRGVVALHLTVNHPLMIQYAPFVTNNRKQAGTLLANKFLHLKDEDTVVIAVPYGGAVVGYHLASALSLPFEVLPCERIDDPGDRRRSIGSISPDDVIIHDDGHDIPRDYLYRQIMINQNALKLKKLFYNGLRPPSKIAGATVILVGDVVGDADSLLACLRTVRNQKASKIIVAATVVTPEAFAQLSACSDEVVLLRIESDVRIENVYEEQSCVKDEDVKELVIQAMLGRSKG